MNFNYTILANGKSHSMSIQAYYDCFVEAHTAAQSGCDCAKQIVSLSPHMCKHKQRSTSHITSAIDTLDNEITQSFRNLFDVCKFLTVYDFKSCAKCDHEFALSEVAAKFNCDCNFKNCVACIRSFSPSKDKVNTNCSCMYCQKCALNMVISNTRVCGKCSGILYSSECLTYRRPLAQLRREIHNL